MSVEKNKENLKMCKCIKCPSYTTVCKIKEMPHNIVEIAKGIDKAKHFEGMFCAFGKSDCIKQKKECICSTCGVEKKYHLTGGMYCLNGTAK